MGFDRWLALSAGLKITAFLALWILFWSPIALVLGKRLDWYPLVGTLPEQKLPLVASLYLLVPGVVWLVLGWEGLPLSAYGLKWQLPLMTSVLSGWFMGLLSLGLVFGLETLGGWIQWRQENWRSWCQLSVPILLLSLWIGLTEEFIFRGLFLTQLQREFSWLWSAVISSLIFALLHLLWERSLTLPQIPGLWLMGMILVIARASDLGSIGIAWGLHSAWVFALASLDSAELIRYQKNEGNWLVGVKNQPLAGVSGFLCLGIAGLLLWLNTFWLTGLGKG